MISQHMTKNCPICKKRPINNKRNKTCGNHHCRGKYAEIKTKNRIKRQMEAEPFIRKCMLITKRDMPDKDICVICGEFLEASLTIHHFDKKKKPNDVATLCGSCHRVFDSSGGGLRDLKRRLERYYKYNLKSLGAVD